MTDYIIYTKPLCKYCMDAKELLDNHGYSYIERDVSDKDALAELRMYVPNAKTVPQIFQYVGGYDDLKFNVNQGGAPL